MDILDHFRKVGALEEGHFILRSGRHSRQYFQCARVLQYPRLASQLIEPLAQQVQTINFDLVVSPAMGGILVGQELARQLDCPHFFTEKEDGKLVFRRFTLPQGSRVLVAEDVITTGSAVKETIRLVEDAGAQVMAVVVLVDRSQKDGVSFGCPCFRLLKMEVETFASDHLPEDLKKLPPIKPGSR